MNTSAHTKIGLENEDTGKLRNEVTLFSTIITVLGIDTELLDEESWCYELLVWQQ